MLISQQIERSSTLLLVSSQLLEEVCVGEANGIDDVVVNDEPDNNGKHRPDEGVVNFFWKSAAALLLWSAFGIVALVSRCVVPVVVVVVAAVPIVDRSPC